MPDCSLELILKRLLDAVEKYQPANNRSQVKNTESNTLICDSYNANPTSMNVALESFSLLKNEPKVVILGDMLELGDKSEEEHMKILNILQSKLPEKVFLVGPVFKKVSEKSGFKAFDNVDRLIDFLKSEALKGKTILIKGSRGIRLEKIYSLLIKTYFKSFSDPANVRFIRRTSDLLPDLTLGPHNP